MLTERDLSERRQRVLNCISEFQAANGGSSPTVREIASALGIRGLGVVHDTLRQLEKRGEIKRTGQARDIRISETSR